MRSVSLLLLCALASYAQGVITTVAGPAAAPLSSVVLDAEDFAVDGAGNLYLRGPNRIRKVTPSGAVSLHSGSGFPGSVTSGLGPMTFDSAGNLYLIGDGGPSAPGQLRKITPDGLMTPLAEISSPSGFGPLINAMTMDSSGNLYYSDSNLRCITRMDPAGNTRTIAGTCAVPPAVTPPFSGDGGPALRAPIGLIWQLAVDTVGNVYFADGTYYRVRKITPEGTITTVAGDGTTRFLGDRSPATANGMVPLGVAVDGDGNLYISDNGGAVRKISAAGVVTTLAGGGGTVISGDGGPANRAGIAYARNVFVDAAKNVFFLDLRAIRKIDSGGTISTVAGLGTTTVVHYPFSLPDDKFSYLSDFAIDLAGNILISDWVPILLTPQGKQTQVSDTPINFVVTDPRGGYFVTRGSQVLRMAPDFTTTAVAGAAGLQAGAIAADAQGNLYVATNSFPYSLYRVTPAGVRTALAGCQLSVPTCADADGISAVNAVLDGPTSITLDPAGNIYLLELNRNRIRKIANGVISTIAGSGAYGPRGDGEAAIHAELGLASLSNPPVRSAIAADANGNVYISDTLNHRIRKVSRGGLITTVAGVELDGYSPSGASLTTAPIAFPGALRLDRAGAVYFSEFVSGRLRKFTPPAPVTVTFATVPAGLPLRVGGVAVTGGYQAALDPGAQITVEAPNLPASPDGVRMSFAGWSDAGPSRHTIKVGSSSTTITATFAPQYRLSFTAQPAAAGRVVVSPPSPDGYYPGNQRVQLAVAPAPGFQFAGFDDESVQPGDLTVTASRTLTARFVCSYQVPDSVSRLGRAAGVIPFAVRTGVGCPIAPATTEDWLVVSPAATPGSFEIRFSALPEGITDRSANIILGGAAIPVLQTARNAPSIPEVFPRLVSGASHSFSLTVRDIDLASNLARLIFSVGNGDPAQSLCRGYLDIASRTLYLLDDASQDPLGPLTPGSSESLRNSQCRLDGANSAIIAAADYQITVNLGLTLLGSLAASPSLTLSARAEDADGLDSGWRKVADWIPDYRGVPPTVIPPASRALLDSPATLSFTAKDANGIPDLLRLSFLVNASTTPATATCYGFYERAANEIYLFDDIQSNLLGPLTPGSPETISNSQCIIDGAASSVAFPSDTELTLSVAISLRARYAQGRKELFASVRDRQEADTGWVSIGTWSHTPPVLAPLLVAATPAGIGDPFVTATFTARDLNGSADLRRISFLFSNAANQLSNACHGYFDPSTRRISLYDDSGAGIVGSLTLSDPKTLSNSQCRLFGSRWSVANPNTTDARLTITVELLGLFATKRVSVFTSISDLQGNETGWIQTAVWVNLGPNLPPEYNCCFGHIVKGPTHQFAARYRDPNGYGDIQRVSVLVDSSPNPGASSCHAYLEPSTNNIYLFNDSLTAVLGPIPAGKPGSLESSRCRIDGASTQVTYAVSGDLFVDWRLTLKEPLAGQPQNLYSSVRDAAGATSVWYPVAEWRPAGTNSEPTILFSTPGVTANATETIDIRMSDWDGFADVQRIYFLLSSQSEPGPNSCYGYFDRVTNEVNLYDDRLQTLFGPIPAGVPGILQNTRCRVDGFGTRVNQASGNFFGINLRIGRQGPGANTRADLYIGIADKATPQPKLSIAASWIP